MNKETLLNVWYGAAKAKAASERAEGSLYGALLAFSKNLDAETFMAETKAMEDILIAKANNPILKKAVRSTASASRSTINKALLAGISTTDKAGKPLGKNKLAEATKGASSPDAPKSSELKQHDDLPSIIAAMIEADPSIAKDLAAELCSIAALVPHLKAALK